MSLVSRISALAARIATEFNSLHAVARTGNYNDLDNKPSTTINLDSLPASSSTAAIQAVAVKQNGVWVRLTWPAFMNAVSASTTPVTVNGAPITVNGEQVEVT